MKTKKTRVRRYIVLPWAVLGVIAALLYVHIKYVTPILRARRINRLIEAYEEEPSQKTTDELARLLERRIATPQQGERILRTLLTPEVTMRKSYCAGKPIALAHQLNCVPAPKRWRKWDDLTLYLRGPAWSGYQCAHSCWNSELHVWTISQKPSVPGRHQIALNHVCEVQPARKEITWQWPTVRRFPFNLIPGRRISISYHDEDKAYYRCIYVTVAEINVRDEADAEKIDLLTAPDLDRRMREAISLSPGEPQTFLGSSKKWQTTGYFCLDFEEPPTTFAFSCHFRFANGNETWTDSNRYGRNCVYAMAGESGARLLSLPSLRAEQTVEFDGTIILRPDPDAAYLDPRIKTIWGGTLEFPVTITIKEKK